MDRSRIWVFFALIDFLLFFVSWVWDSLGLVGPHSGWSFIVVVYWLSSILGLCLVIYGFWVLIRARFTPTTPSVLVILFAMAPGCAAFIGLFSHLGLQPV